MTRAIRNAIGKAHVLIYVRAWIRGSRLDSGIIFAADIYTCFMLGNSCFSACSNANFRNFIAAGSFWTLV